MQVTITFDLSKGPKEIQAQLAQWDRLLGNREIIGTGPTEKATKKTTPAKTVSDEEPETFGKKAMKRKDLEEDAEEDEELEASDDDETDTDADEESEDDEDDAEEPSVTFQEVKAAVNKYGEKHPDQMRAILKGFKIDSPKELSATRNEKHWEPIYRKVMAKIKASKKAK